MSPLGQAGQGLRAFDVRHRAPGQRVPSTRGKIRRWCFAGAEGCWRRLFAVSRDTALAAPKRAFAMGALEEPQRADSWAMVDCQPQAQTAAGIDCGCRGLDITGCAGTLEDGPRRAVPIAVACCGTAQMTGPVWGATIPAWLTGGTFLPVTARNRNSSPACSAG